MANLIIYNFSNIWEAFYILFFKTLPTIKIVYFTFQGTCASRRTFSGTKLSDITEMSIILVMG